MENFVIGFVAGFVFAMMLRWVVSTIRKNQIPKLSDNNPSDDCDDGPGD